ncbi:MAG: hypothetical protein A2091_03380 [Desulfuromonadales bacterium GWD2_61_12]|nr:MAG: hypothetical protein A2005_06300 [Desulfuromonadales bacterium GWC2_61_20]OGR34945.1 MAG: hypothetical protein A2091_03380 [Desulfuromonadales bacterium GWD2_61_12]
MLALWRQNRTFPVAIAALLLVNLGLFLLLVLFLAPRSEVLEREYIELQARTRQGKVVESETPQERFTRMETDLESFLAIVPERSELSGLIAELYEQAGASGLVVQQVGYTPTEIPEHGLLSYALNFSLTGTYGEIKHFIFRLEQAERLVIIEQMSLSAASSIDKPRQVTLNLRLTTYFRSNVPI